MIHPLFSLLGLLSLTSTASAAGQHAGIPVSGHQDLGTPTFLSADSGWEAPVLDSTGQPLGVARVFVAAAPDAAAQWTDDALRAVQTTLPAVVGLGDVAWGAGPVVVIRDGNVALSVILSDGVAQPLAADLLATLEDQPAAWPAVAVARQANGLTFFDSPDAIAWTVEGGRRPLGQAGYLDLPSTVVVWDAWGRAAVLVP